MTDRHRLPFSFDPATLKADLAALSAEGWLPHFNTGFYDGDWSGLVLRGPVEDRGLYAADGEMEDKPALAACPALRGVIAAFDCPIRSVRLMRLGPGAVIHEHRDYDLGLDRGEVRLHVPVVTNPDVDFRLNNRRVDMAEGEIWYLDLHHPHRVANRGATGRVHLVLDLVVNDWLRSFLPAEEMASERSSEPTPDPVAAAAALEAFRALVAIRPDLHAELADIVDADLFARETVRLAAGQGFVFTAREVAQAAAVERRRWNAAWLT